MIALLKFAFVVSYAVLDSCSTAKVRHEMLLGKEAPCMMQKTKTFFGSIAGVPSDQRPGIL